MAQKFFEMMGSIMLLISNIYKIKKKIDNRMIIKYDDCLVLSFHEFQ